MLQWVTHVLVDAIVLLLAARLLSSVEVKGSSTASIVACIIGILSFLISWSIDSILALTSLGLIYFLSIGFITRIIAFTIVLQVTDKVSENFKTSGFGMSVLLAIIITIAGVILDAFLFEKLPS